MKLPNTFQTQILQRFMSDKELQSLYSEYKDNRKRYYRTREVTDKDLSILIDYKKGMLVNEIEKKYRLSRGGVNTALRVAALSKIK